MDRVYRPDRDRDRDYRDRDRDRDRVRGDRDFHHQPRRPSRFSDGPPPPDQRRSPSDYRGGFSTSRRAFDSPPRMLPGGAPPPVSGGPPGGFWPMSGGVGGPTRSFGNDFAALNDFSGPPPQRPNDYPGPPLAPRNDFPGPPPPLRNELSGPPPQQLSGQKRGFPSSGRGDTPEHYDGRSFVKLFVGSVPRTATEEEIRPLFEEQGKVLEIALIKDKRTGQQQGCCFIKYATSEEADRAIRALHNQYTLPGGVGPIQVRYADGERERLGNGAVEYKLFIGSLNKFATEKEVEEIFAPYGHIEDVYLMRDERKQSRGCGFVKFSNKDSAMAAINALNGIYTMRGCEQPLTVRFADPKRPRAGEPRASPSFGGPGVGPSPSPGIRPAPGPNFPGPMGSRGPPNAWQPMSPQNAGQSPYGGGIHDFSNQLPSRPGEAAISPTPGGHLRPQGSLAEGSVVTGAVSQMPGRSSPQNSNQSFPQRPLSNQRISPLQKPLQSPQHFPPALQLHQGPGSYSQAPTSQASMRPFNQLQSGAQASYSQAGLPFSSQQHNLPAQLPPAQFQLQQSAISATTQPQPNSASSLTNSQLPAPTPQHPFPYKQSPSQLAQMLSQQTQTLQATFQSSQQAFSQLQQQLHMIQPSAQNQPLQQAFQASKQQPQWPGAIPTTAASAPLAPTPDAPSISSGPVGIVAPKTTPLKCSWTEHTSPDGYKYYYNSATGESKWLKPEELTLYEQQQQKLAVQQLQPQPSVQAIPTQQVSQPQLSQVQTQFRSTEQLQHPPLSSMYQAPRAVRNQTAPLTTYSQPSAPANSVYDLARFQQGFPATQDWGWKTNSGGK